MTIVRGGQAGSGLDRALGNALRAELDDILESGELYEGERADFPEPYGPYDPNARPWQMPFDAPRPPPATAESLPDALRDRMNAPRPVDAGGGGADSGAAPGQVADASARLRTPGVPPPPPEAGGNSDDRWIEHGGLPPSPRDGVVARKFLTNATSRSSPSRPTTGATAVSASGVLWLGA